MSRRNRGKGKTIRSNGSAAQTASQQTIPPQQWVLDDYKGRVVALSNLARVARHVGDIDMSYASSRAAKNVWAWYVYVKSMPIVEFKLWYWREFIASANYTAPAPLANRMPVSV